MTTKVPKQELNACDDKMCKMILTKEVVGVIVLVGSYCVIDLTI